VVSLAANTRLLLKSDPAAATVHRVRVEYHLLSGRELYDNTILTPDRHHSSAGRWIIGPHNPPYEIKVISYPYYSLPQELCLAFDCFQQLEKNEGVHVSWLPYEDVVHDLLVLLSVFAREPVTPVGLRREDNEPIAGRPDRTYPVTRQRGPTREPCGINSREFAAIVRGLANSTDPTVNAVLSACEFYHVGLSLVTFNASLAYFSFVSAIECLASHHYKTRKFDFDRLRKFEKAKSTIDQIAKFKNTEPLITKLKDDLLSGEYFLRQKFVLFLTEFVVPSFWDHADELYRETAVFTAISREHFDWCLKKIYDARSSFVHSGTPLPQYVAFGLRTSEAPQTVSQLMSLREKERYLPLLTWFERLCHVTIIEFMRRHVAPELALSDKAKRENRERLLKDITALPSKAKGSLTALVTWTAQFLGYAVINPHAPNREWADSPESVELLRKTGIIDGKGVDMEGSSWLKNREIGEVAGEFVFGQKENPFRGNEILLPPESENA
jgi:hypothetical protein